MAKMLPKSASTAPGETLREQCGALEDAIALILVKPRKEPVHKLRTATRRIEAQLEMLCLLEPTTKQLTGITASGRKIRKLLDAVRKAAGKVRDCDVQRLILKDAMRESDKKRFQDEVRDLRGTLKAQRDKEAETLLAELNGHAHKLPRQLERFLKQLEPADDLTVPSDRMSALIQGWYQEHEAGSAGSAGALHETRKAAKLARYMAESAGLVPLAAGFENIQQVGGSWHDALTLRKTACKHLGKKSELVAVLSSMEEASLSDFKQTLGSDEDETPEGVAP